MIFCKGSQRTVGLSCEKMDGTLKFMRKWREVPWITKQLLCRIRGFFFHYRKTQNHYYDLPFVLPLLLDAGTGLLNGLWMVTVVSNGGRAARGFLWLELLSAFALGERNKVKRRVGQLDGHFLVITKNWVYSLVVVITSL